MQEREKLMRDIASIRLRLDALEDGHKTVTFDALYTMRQDIDKLEQCVSKLEEDTAGIGRVESRIPVYGVGTSSFKKNKIGIDIDKNTENVKDTLSPVCKKLSEMSIGKYGIGILAAALILLAVGVAISAFWWIIPEIGKFSIIFGFGIIMLTMGEYLLREKRVEGQVNKNGFWLSLMSCGAGIVFCAVTAGAIVWHLYNTMIAGLLYVIWFGVSYGLASLHKSRVFYIIAYIGGYVAVALAVMSFGGVFELYKQVCLTLMLAVVLVVGLIGGLRRDSRLIWICNAVFAFLSALTIADVVPDYPVTFLMGVVFSLCYLGFVCLQFILNDETTPAFIVRAIVTFLSALLVMDALLRIADFVGFNMMLAGLFIGTWLIFRRPQGMILGLAPVLADIVGGISKDICGVACLLPCILAAIGFALPSVQKDGRFKLTALVFYLVGVTFTSKIEGGVALIAIYSGIVALPPAIDYIMRTIKRGAPYYLVERTGMIVCLSLSLWRLWPYSGYGKALVVTVGVCCMLAHKYLVLCGASNEISTDLRVSKLIFILYMFVVHLLAYVFLWNPNIISRILLSLVITAMDISVIYECIVRERGLILTGGANFLCNLSLRFIARVMFKRNMSLLASLLGLLLSVFFVLLGFKFRRKNLRLWGLTSIVVYVIWIVLAVSFSNSSVSTVIMLLLGGIVLFGVSFVYNKVSKMFDLPEKK